MSGASVAPPAALPAAVSTAGFASYEELSRAHRARLGQLRNMNEAAVGAFVSAVRVTGVRLADPEERERAQGILDFWVAELIGRDGVDVRAWISDPLDPFDGSDETAAIKPPPAEVAPSASTSAPADPVPHSSKWRSAQFPRDVALAASRLASGAPGWLGAVLDPIGGLLAKVSPVADALYGLSQGAKENRSAKAAPPQDETAKQASNARAGVRLAAVARQWRGTGAEGYLLNGQALADAERFVDDPDIRALVNASRRAAKRRNRLWRWIIGVAVAILVGTVIVLIIQNRTKDAALAERDSALKESAIQKNLADRRRSLAESNAAAEVAARQAAESAAASALDRLRQLEARQAQLDAAVALIRREVAAGRLAAAAVPPSLAPLVEIEATAPALALPAPESALLSGYRPDFLGIVVPPPSSTAPGPTLAYANFTVVLDPVRRIGRIAAVNIDRQGLRVLPDAGLKALVTDPRVPATQQPDPVWFGGDGRVARGRLVSGSEIAWGAAAEGAADVAARRVAGMVDALPNAAVQLAPFRDGAWSGLTRWVLTRFAPDSARVTAFGGPVLGNDDPVVDGIAVPRAYWKVVVGRDLGGTLVVDAFLLPQAVDGSGIPLQRAEFDPENLRATIDQVEAATGLDFGDEVRAAGPKDRRRVPSPTGEGDRLAAKVGQLDTVAPIQRTAVAQELISALRDGALTALDQRVVAAALVRMAGDDVMPGLTRTGRYNLSFVLSEIPAALWDRPDWLDLKAQARRAVAALEARAQAGTPTVGPATQRFLDTLKTRLDWQAAQGITVYLQFAGMTRDAAVAVGQDLRSLGWAVPGEEQTAAAVRRNEVRYGDPEDADAARLLAADLRAQGLTRVTAVKRNPDIKARILEVWISQ